MPVKYPGVRKTEDGSNVIVWVETHISQGACAYPITPSTNMGQGFQAAVAKIDTDLIEKGMKGKRLVYLL